MAESKAQPAVQEVYNKDEQIVVNEIRARHTDAKKFKFTKAVGNFLGGTVYYVEFHSSEQDADSNFYYAYADKDGCRLYDDGMNIIEWCIDALEKRRTFIQRINEFELHELIASIIAIIISLSFVGLLAFGGIKSAAEVMPIFTLVLGYYFGQGKTVK